MQQILEMVAKYVTDDELRASWYLWKDAFKLMSGRFKSAELFARLVNAGGDLVSTRYSMPLAEALDADSGVIPSRFKLKRTPSNKNRKFPTSED